jgi:hypothetical protein
VAGYSLFSCGLFYLVGVLRNETCRCAAAMTRLAIVPVSWPAFNWSNAPNDRGEFFGCECVAGKVKSAALLLVQFECHFRFLLRTEFRNGQRFLRSAMPRHSTFGPAAILFTLEVVAQARFCRFSFSATDTLASTSGNPSAGNGIEPRGSLNRA